MSNLNVASSLKIPHSTIQCLRNPNNAKHWSPIPFDGYTTIEMAVFRHFQSEGWAGYCGEGGLILNLIKSMSFEEVNVSERATFVESLYHSRFDLVAGIPKSRRPNEREIGEMLTAISNATVEQITRNFEIMVSKVPVVIKEGCVTSTQKASMLDFFPRLEKWMFIDLFKLLGAETIQKIARIFSTDPYLFRQGWLDLTIWRGNEVRFVEIKGPNDRMRKAQINIIQNVLQPLGLSAELVDVLARC